MVAPSDPNGLDKLGKRIAEARRAHGMDPGPEGDVHQASAMGGAAWRIATELVVAVCICTGIGWAVDQWLETTPWVMLGMLVLGFAAGVNNAVRMTLKMDADAAEQAAAETAATGKTGAGQNDA